MALMSRERGPVPPVILLAVILLQIGLHRTLPIASPIPDPLQWTGLGLIVLGIGVIASKAVAFRKAATTIIPFEESSSLVVSGLFRYTRNPMYVGMVLILLGVATLCGSLSPFIGPFVFVPVLNARVIRHEEAMLETQFGQSYRDYKAKVRRWI
ncbi:MAG: isoprenylcysteine carboxylmethyltransferase family protein [Pseudomonadota bacterium]